MNNNCSHLFKLDTSGDVELTWNHTDPADVTRAREELEALRDAGYTFFLVDGTPADEVAAGQGALKCRRATVDELLPEAPIDPDKPPPLRVGKRKGREKDAEPVVAVATRPMRGG